MECNGYYGVPLLVLIPFSWHQLWFHRVRVEDSLSLQDQRRAHPIEEERTLVKLDISHTSGTFFFPFGLTVTVPSNSMALFTMV
jgi:hypothetical protein